MKIFVLIIFALMYVFVIALPKYKVLSVGISTVVCSVGVLAFGLTSFGELISIDYNVLMMLVGIMLAVGMFSESGMPNKLADKIMSKIPNSLLAIILLCVLSGFISAFVDNVATVLMLAPIGLAVSKKANVSPIFVIIGIAVSSNLQGAATLVGDTTSIMLGSFADMNFFEFFFLDGKLSIFWAVELGAIMTIPILCILFRKESKRIIIEPENIKVTSIVPTVLLLLNILALVVTSFVDDKIEILNGLICMGFGLVSYVYYVVRFKLNPVKSLTQVLDYETVLFLFFLFVMISVVKTVGIIDDLSQVFIGIGNQNIFLLFTLIVFGSVVISAFIDNIPYVATMLPVIQTLCMGLTGVSPYLLYLGLLTGATLGGNLTPIGASANIVGIGILKKEGHKVTSKDFLKIGIPFTLTAVISGYLLIWFVWGI